MIYFVSDSLHYAAFYMLSKCLNPDCLATFRYLKEGRLYRVPMPPNRPRPENSTPPSRQQQHVEHFWLCQECSHRFALIVDEHGEVHLLPHKPVAVAHLPAAVHADVREASAG